MAKEPHADVQIEFDSIVLPLMLASQNGHKMWSTRYAPALAAQMFTEAARYAHVPPEQEAIVAQDEWHAGFGEMDYKADKRYAAAAGVDARYKGQLVLGPEVTKVGSAFPYTFPFVFAFAGTGVKAAKLGTDIYLAASQYLYKLVSGAWELVQTFAVSITDLHVFGDSSGNSYLFIALGGSVKYYWTADGATFTQATPAESVADYFGTELSALWKAKKPNELKSTKDPTNTVNPWSTATYVGDSYFNVTDLEQYNERLQVGKEDGLYNLDSAGNIYNILPIPAYPNSNNFSGMKVFPGDGLLYMPMGENGLEVYDGPNSMFIAISPSIYGARLSDYLGQITALEGDQDWFYVVTSGANLILWAVRRETIDGATDWRWHPLATLTHTSVNHMVIQDEKLWMVGTDEVSYIIRPTYYIAPQDDSSYRFCASGTILTPYYNFNFADIDKACFSFTLLSSALATGAQTVKVEWQKDADTTWTELNGVGSGTFSIIPSQTIYFQANTTGKKIRFRLTFATTANTATPVVLGYVGRGRLKPTKRRLFDFTIRCADKVMLKGGVQSNLLGAYIDTQLHNAEAKVWPVTFYDRRGISWSVGILDINEVEIEEQEKDKFETGLRVLALECKVS